MGIGHEEWRGLPWHIRRAYLEGMEQDENVPLAFERQEEQDVPGELRWQERKAEGASVIDITGMISDLEASRNSTAGGR